MIEAAGDRQRRRGEHPRGVRTLAVLAQRAGDIERRALQAEAARRQLEPAARRLRPRSPAVRRNPPASGHFHPAPQPPRELHAPAHGKLSKPGEASRNARQRFGEALQRIEQLRACIAHRRFLQRAPARAARRQHFHRRAQHARRLFEMLRRPLHRRDRRAHVLAFGDRVAREFDQRPRAQRLRRRTARRDPATGALRRPRRPARPAGFRRSLPASAPGRRAADGG